MPLIIMESSKLNRDQKVQLAKELTECASRILNISTDHFTVYLKENDRDNIATGGVLLSDRGK